MDLHCSTVKGNFAFSFLPFFFLFIISNFFLVSVYWSMRNKSKMLQNQDPQVQGKKASKPHPKPPKVPKTSNPKPSKAPKAVPVQCNVCSKTCPNHHALNHHLKKHKSKLAPSPRPKSSVDALSQSLSSTLTLNSTTPCQMPQQTLQMLLGSSLEHSEEDDDDFEESDESDLEEEDNEEECSEVNREMEEVDDKVSKYFFKSKRDSSLQSQSQRGMVLGDAQTASFFRDAAYFGQLIPSSSASTSSSSSSSTSSSSPSDSEEEVFLNTHEPFCFVTVGTQGAGKSHTMCCLLESCLIPAPLPPGREIVRLHHPMAALMLHYEQNQSSVCEATGLTCALPAVIRMFQGTGYSPVLPREKLVVLVSPSYYRQRKAFYGDYCLVKPLLFPWASLSADHIKRIMRIGEKDSQLYVAALLDLLRKYQRDCVVPGFQSFLQQIASMCNTPGQASPLRQRSSLLESLVAESDLNASLRAEGGDLASCIGPGVLVIADLTDPLLSSEEANGIFQVLTEQFRTCHIPEGCGKLLALDEAHKFMRGGQSDGLSDSIVSAARLMRHDGLRVAISTQSPLTLAPELLELVSIAVLHRFHSASWFSYLQGKIPLGEGSWEQILSLPTGTALVFASKHQVKRHPQRRRESEGWGEREGEKEGQGEGSLMKIAIRPRLTADRGRSKTNSLLPSSGK